MCTSHHSATTTSERTAPRMPTLERSLTTPRTLALAAHESLCVVDAQGRPLVNILATDAGPVLQLPSADLQLDVAGKLQIQADQVEMTARDGEMKLFAKDDIIARGERIRLN
jgi:hypothetical protein